MSTTQETETEVVTGQVTGVITKGPDKWQITVSTGGQYARNLWTKDFALVSQMQQAIGQHFSFICGKSHWTNQSGQPVTSLWVNGIQAPGAPPMTQPVGQQPPMQQPVQQQPQQWQQPVPQQQPMQQQAPQPTLSPLEKDMRIMREAAIHAVSRMLGHMHPDERNAVGMISLAENFVRYYQQGPSAFPALQQQAQQAQQQRAPEAPGYGYEPDGDPGHPPDYQPPADEWPA